MIMIYTICMFISGVPWVSDKALSIGKRASMYRCAEILHNANSRWGPIVFILNETWCREINLLEARVSSNVDHPLLGDKKACRSPGCSYSHQIMIVKVSRRLVGEEMERSWFRKGKRLLLSPKSMSSWISKCCRLGNRLKWYRPPANWLSSPRIL